MSVNSPGFGINFEVSVPAYFCLTLFEDPQIEDFSMTSNNGNYGKFDDLVIYLKTKNNTHKYYAIQLKHNKESKKLQPNNFSSSQDYQLDKYCKTFANLSQEEQEKFTFILYTTRYFDRKKASEVKEFDVKLQRLGEEDNFFDTSNCNESCNVYKFSTNQETVFNETCTREIYERFFKKFYLYSCQSKYKELDKRIVAHFFDKYGAKEEIAVNFINFIRRWHDEEYSKKIKLTKKDIQIQLIRFLSSNFLELGSISDPDNLLQESINLGFDFITIESLSQELINEPTLPRSTQETLDSARKLKVVTKDCTELTPEDHCKLLCFSGTHPMILKLTKDSKVLVQSIINISTSCRSGIKIILLYTDEQLLPKFPFSIKVMKNLFDIYLQSRELFEKITSFATISLQGRLKILIKDFLHGNLEVAKFIKINQLIEGFNKKFVIGRQSEKLLPYYIPRRLSTVEVKIDSILNLKTETIFINCNGKSEKIKKYLKDNSKFGAILDATKINHSNFPDRFIMLKDSGFYDLELEEFSAGRQEAIYLQSQDEVSFMWVSTKSQSGKFSSFPLDESDIFNTFSNSTANLICANPGMGKTVMLQFLAQNSPSEVWAVRINLRDHNIFFAASNHVDKILDYFLKNELNNVGLEEQVKIFLKETRRICFFFDGLDELQVKYIPEAINCVRKLSLDGYKVWISSRSNLREDLEQKLNILSLDIQQFDRINQKVFIEKRLTKYYAPRIINIIINKIYGNLKILNNEEIMGVPLQLYMITQIFRANHISNNTLKDELLMITHMYRQYFDQKILHHLNKTAVLHMPLEQMYRDRWKNYLVAGLKSCLDPEIFQSLPIKDSYEEFFAKIREENFSLGIIVNIGEDEIPRFEHHTHGEFFAACWLAINFSKLKNLKLFIFNKKYYNVRFMMDMELAENCQGHIHVLYKDFYGLERCYNQCSGEKDKVGRSLLHLACSYGEIYPILNITRKGRYFLVDDKESGLIRKENENLVKILIFLLKKSFDPLEQDQEFFNWNSIQYADASFSLNLVEIILKYFKENKRSVNLKCLKNYQDSPLLIYYSTRFGLVHLFQLVRSSTISKNTWNLFCMVSDNYRILNMRNSTNGNFLHLASESGQIEIAHTLIIKGVELNSVDDYRRSPLDVALKNKHVPLQILLKSKGEIEVKENTKYFLHWACEKGYSKIVEFLMTTMTIDSLDDNHQTPLHISAYHGQLNIIHQLLNGGANIDFLTKTGETPLQLACLGGHLEGVKILINRGADYKIINDKNGWSLVHYSASGGRVQVLHFLIDQLKLAVDLHDLSGRTPLHLASKFGDADAITFLLSKNADSRTCDKLMYTALHYAAAEGHTNAIDLLLNQNSLDKIYDFDKTKIIDHVIDNGTNKGEIQIINFLEQMKLESAVFIKIDKLLLDEAEEPKLYYNEPLHLACLQGHLNPVKLLLQRGANMSCLNCFGWTPLDCAAIKGHKEVLDTLINNSSIPAEDFSSSLSTVFNLAVLNDNLNIVEYLLKRGYEVNFSNDEGQTAVHFGCYARTKESLKMLRLLQNEDAFLAARDDFGWTALHYAAARDWKNAVEFLLNNMIDTGAVDSNRETALELAVRRGCFGVIGVLSLTSTGRVSRRTIYFE